MAISAKYVFFGDLNTGGQKHQRMFFETLVESLQKNKPVQKEIIHIDGKWKWLGGWLQLAFKGFSKTKSDVLVIPVRLATGAFLRTLLFKTKTFVVIHNYDPQSWQMKAYFSLLFKATSLIKTKNFYFVTVSDHWVNLLKEKTKLPIFIFPNLFQNSDYSKFKNQDKKKQVYFGLYSSKQDFNAYEKIYRELIKHGYECYFSLPDKSSTKLIESPIPIRFVTHESYLQQMAESLFTISMPEIEEGWGRVSHESILVGTNVIGFAKGGHANLLKESDSIIAKDAQDVIEFILNNNTVFNPTNTFINRYDDANKGYFISEIINKCF